MRFVVALAMTLVGALPTGEAQEKTSAPRIGVMWPTSDNATLQGFRQGLRELGYVEGQNILIEYRYADGSDEVLPKLAAELVGLKVDVIVTWGMLAARVAKKATTTIPIVNGSMSDPLQGGLVQSLARPGGNLTGLTSQTRELNGKRVELLKELVPELSRLAALATPNPSARLGVKEIEQTTRALGLQLQVIEVHGPEDFNRAFSNMASERAGAFIVLPDLMFSQHRQRLVDLAAQHSLPATYFSDDFVKAGGLVSYAPSFPDLFRRAAGYVDRILKGAKPADMPVEQASKFELVINLKTAKALGLTIPPSLVLRADRVIE